MPILTGIFKVYEYEIKDINKIELNTINVTQNIFICLIMYFTIIDTNVSNQFQISFNCVYYYKSSNSIINIYLKQILNDLSFL